MELTWRMGVAVAVIVVLSGAGGFFLGQHWTVHGGLSGDTATYNTNNCFKINAANIPPPFNQYIPASDKNATYAICKVS